MSTKEGTLNRIVDRTIFDGCWTCTLYRDKNGYCQIKVSGKVMRVHRVAYLICVGPIPRHLTIDHDCLNEACWNPDHLTLRTNGDNVKRARGSLSGSCVNGHKMTEENSIRRSDGYVQCRICQNKRKREYNQRQKGRD